MATVVCQGLQSCLDSQLEPRTLRLRLSSPRPHLSQPLEIALKPFFFDSNNTQLGEECQHEETSKKTEFVRDKHISSNPDSGGWSFLQALSNASQGRPKAAMETEQTYVHPLVKRCSSTLSEKSLELCTENLGSETGTDIIEDSIFSLSSLSSDSDGGNSPRREQLKTRRLMAARKSNNSRSFPPPLTTISGSDSLKVRSNREDGRLIIKAVKAPPTHTCFQAERSNGRLRLRLSSFKDSTSNFDSEEDTAGSEEPEIAANEDSEKQGFENDAHCEEPEEMEDEEEDEDDEEMVGNDREVGAEMEMERLQRPSRCKDGEHEQNKGMMNWEPLWVATS